MIAIATFLLAAMTAAPETAPADPPAEPPGRPEAYGGSLGIFEVDEVTVVYPGGSGDDVALHRRSATARARTLESRHGIKTHVVADVEATPEDLKRHLILLGWTNRLLGTPRAPRPFERRGGGFALFGDVAGAAGDDLLLYGPSPYAPAKVLLFWSRIDPEADRFMPWPHVGSDWAVVRGYRPLRQGMCLPGTDWPPVRDPRAEADHEASDASRPPLAVVRSAPHVRVRSLPDLPATELDAIAATREQAVGAAARKLGVPTPEGFVVDVSVYPDDETKVDRTGVGDPVHAIPRRRELHMTRRTARNPSPHEEIHLLARERIGACFSTALYEGLAVDLEGTYRGQDLEAQGVVLLASGRIAAASALLDEERLRRTAESGGIVGAGLLARWIRVSRQDRFQAVYTLPDPSPEAVAAALGFTVAELDEAFRHWLDQLASHRSGDVAFAAAERQAQEHLRGGDYARAAEALERALAARPDDPQTLFNLASARMRTDALDSAEAAFRRLLALPLSAEQARFRIFSHYQLGRIFDLQGRREEALVQYRRVLELPDQYDAHRLAKERIATPATRGQLE